MNITLVILKAPTKRTWLGYFGYVRNSLLQKELTQANPQQQGNLIYTVSCRSFYIYFSQIKYIGRTNISQRDWESLKLRLLLNYSIDVCAIIISYHSNFELYESNNCHHI